MELILIAGEVCDTGADSFFLRRTKFSGHPGWLREFPLKRGAAIADNIPNLTEIPESLKCLANKKSSTNQELQAIGFADAQETF